MAGIPTSHRQVCFSCAEFTSEPSGSIHASQIDDQEPLAVLSISNKTPMPRMALPFDDWLIVQALWPDLSEGEFRAEKSQYTSYLKYVKDKLSAVDSDSGDLQSITSSDIVLIISEVRRLKGSPRSEIVAEVKSRLAHGNPSDIALSNAVDLAARLWLTLHVRSSPSGPLSGVLHWNNSHSLDALLASFPAVTVAAGGKRTTVQSDLTMASLISNHGFSVHWTDNLADHLSFHRDRRVLTVYEHKICLRNHHHFGDASALPRTVVEEAIDTLNLLFPSDDPRTKWLLRAHKKTFHDLGFCGRPRSVEMSRYPCWGSQIEDLSTIIDEVPAGWEQFLPKKNGKNALSFATFWIATAVGILTIISFVTGVISPFSSTNFR
jgi:hypothetical protein